MSSKSITEMSEDIDAEFDHIVAHGNDDELFASGYLRGHFDLIVARLTMAGEEDQAKFWPALYASVAEHAGELNDSDRVLVEGMVTRLEQKAKATAAR
ncbi:YfcL family protein [Aliidiomarina quisquiliarum]|uniref:YfcL family protein n=1 Tax=Aliidiomarina quisquiliarum TaxID=2938947 RepID=UPI00208E3ECA|nr:YfcL family protein [Aliidiomarina quisquiliarum]MCO4322042.1 YfcL family protein [Aliidiomarina quisquiliarum]